MKKFITTFAAGILALSAFADQWSTTFSGRSDATFQYQYFSQKNSLADSLLVKQDSSMTFGLGTNKANASTLLFGVYTFDASGNILTTQTFDLASGGLFSMDFSAGDRVGFWLDMGNGEINSMNAQTHANAAGQSFWVSNTTTKPTNEMTLHFGDTTVSKFGVTIGFNGGGGSSTPSGQPMPGAMATSVLAAVILGAVVIGRRRRK